LADQTHGFAMDAAKRMAHASVQVKVMKTGVSSFPITYPSTRFRSASQVWTQQGRTGRAVTLSGYPVAWIGQGFLA